MKKLISIITFQVILLVSITGNICGQNYTQVAVTGFTVDMIANGGPGTNQALNSTSALFDGDNTWAGHVMYSTDFRGNYNPSTAPAGGLPVNRQITSINNSAITYMLQPYTGNNVLLLTTSNTTGTLSLTTPQSYQKLSILASSAEGASTFTVRLNFNDATYADYSFNVKDWFNGTGYAINNIGRVNRHNYTQVSGHDLYDQIDGTAASNGNPRLYDCFITLTNNDMFKVLTSIRFTWTGSGNSRTAILAVCGLNPLSAPVATAATSITYTSFSANWNSVAYATKYRLDVSTVSDFSSFVSGYSNLDVGNVTTYSVSGLSSGTYYYRLRAENSNGQSIHSNIITVCSINKWKGTTSTDFNTISNWTMAEIPSSSANIIFDDAPVNHCYLDQNRTIGSITNSQSIYNFVLNGKQLTLQGSLNFTNGAKIDAAVTSSVLNFQGSSTQSIPQSAFVSNLAYSVIVNNGSGLILNSDIGITNSLTLTSGILNLNGKTMTINSGTTITRSGGSISGTPVFAGTADIIYDQSSSLIITGSELPDDQTKIRNININTSNNVYLGKSITINGVLNFSKGRISVGSFDLKIDPAGTIKGYDSSKYIIAGGDDYSAASGKVIRFIKNTTASADQVFPVGTETSYSPCYLATTNLTGTNYMVNLFDMVRENGHTGAEITTNVIMRTWDITPENTGNANTTTITLQWNPGDEAGGFDRNLASMVRNEHIPGNDIWTTIAGSFEKQISVAPFTMSIDGIATFSNFGGKTNPPEALPISLIEFKTECLNGNQKLTWVTASEKNNHHFTIEKSSDAINWYEAGIVAGACNSNKMIIYGFSDIESDNIVYYRLKQTDYNGDYSYSKIITAIPCQQNPTGNINVYPNPFKDFVCLSINSLNKSDVSVFIENISGKKVFVATYKPSQTGNEIRLDLSSLPVGTYFIYFSDDRQKGVKIIKQ